MKVDSVVLQVPMVTMAKLELRDLQVYRYVRSLNSTCRREIRHIDPHTSDMLTLFPPFPLSLWRNATGIDGAQRRERRVRRYWSPRIDGTPRFTWTTCKSLSPLYNNIPPTLIQLASLLAFLVIAQLKVSISMRGRATIV